MPSPPHLSSSHVGSGPDQQRGSRAPRTRQRAGGFQVAAPSRSHPPSLLVAGVVLILFFGAVGALLMERAGERREVLALGRTVPMGQRLTAADLRVVRVSVDPGVHAIAGSAAARVVGRVAATTLLAGTLLAPEALDADGAPEPGTAIVGLDLKGAQLPLPAGMLPAGVQVRLVLTPVGDGQAPADAAGAGDPAAVLVDRASLYSVDASPDADSVHVAVVVDEADAATVLRAGAAGRVGVALLSRAGRGS